MLFAPAMLPFTSGQARSATNLERIIPGVAPYLRMRNANTGERIEGVYWSAAGYNLDVVADLNWFMRDWREREERQMDVRIFWMLSAISQAAMQEGHDGWIRFNSGYRTRKTNEKLEGAAVNSLHLKARAADFALPGVPVVKVRDYAAWLGEGGVGHYPGSFVHIDTGPVRHWTG